MNGLFLLQNPSKTAKVTALTVKSQRLFYFNFYLRKTMLLAFHNDPAIKQKYLNRVMTHAKADEIIQGKYWEDGKGCAVGCTIHGGDHRKYETELGIPRIIARLEDGIFEKLPNEAAREFPSQFLEAIPVGADLSIVFYQFMHWLLVDKEEGVIKFASEKGKAAIQSVADLFQKKINAEHIEIKDWRAAADAAASASASAAAAAAYAAAAAAASAAYAAAYAAAADAAYASAAYASAYAAAADAADAAAYASAADAAGAHALACTKQAKKLLELLKTSPVPINPVEVV